MIHTRIATKSPATRRAAAAILLVLVTSCSATAAESDDTADQTRPSTADAATSSSDTGAKTNDLTLPIDALLVRSANDAKLIQSAWEVVVRRCMSSRGLTYSPYPPGRPMTPLDQAIRYGLLTVENAQQYGYRNPHAVEDAAAESAILELEADREAEGPVYLNALCGTETAAADGTFTTDGGCLDEADAEIWGDAGGLSGLAGYQRTIDLQTTSNDALYAGTEGRKAVEEWSACMARAGFEYSAWWQPRQEFPIAASDATPPSPTERTVATADATCRDESQLEVRLASAERTILNDLMKPDTELYDNFETEIGDVVSRASRIIEES